MTASDDKDVKISVVETLIPQKRAQSVFRFDLDSSRLTTFGAHYVRRFEHLVKVTDEAGRELAFSHGRDEVVIQLREPAPPDKPVKVRFEIDGDFLVRPGGDSYWELGVWSWFPQPELCEQFFTFHSLVKVKKPFIPFATGRTVRRAAEGDENVLETREDNPIMWPIVLAGDYTFKDEVRDGVTIRVATYALKNDRAVKQLTDLSSTIIKFYTGFLGPFPFPEFNIIEINEVGFGQAPPGVMFITKEAFNPLGGRGEPDLLRRHQRAVCARDRAPVLGPDGEDAERRGAVAHGVLRGVLGGPLHEGGQGRRGVQDAARPLEGPREVRHRRRADSAGQPRGHLERIPQADRHSQRAALRQGAGAAAALHKQLGDDAFLTFLNSFQKSFRWKFGSTKKVVGLLNFMTKQDFGPFFEANYWGTAMPKD